ncbi:MAG: hypothetical protein IPH13_22310 [Planctomycetes bacterium]|nr:hypothetical protein [Planctomycetota bacterium]MCC7169258.1 hypothetical protein [Planctomycetota bacterium]
MRSRCLTLLMFALASQTFARDDESILLVLHANQPKVTVLDAERGRRLKTIQLERECVDFEVAADGRHLYLSNEGEARISVVDLTGKDPARSIELGGSGEARGLALSGTDLVVALSGAGQVVLVDVAKGVVKKRIDVRGRSLDRVATAGNYGKTAYVSESTTGEVYVVDLDRGSVVYTVPTGATAGSIAIDAQSGEVWVADRTLGQLRVIAAKTAQAVRTVECPGGPQRVVLGGGRVFALCTDSADIAVVRGGAKTIDRRIPIRIEFGGAGTLGLDRMAQEPGGKHAFLGGGNERRILVLDLEALEIRNRFDVDAPVLELLCIKEPEGLGAPKALKREKLKKDGEDKDDAKDGAGGETKQDEP